MQLLLDRWVMNSCAGAQTAFPGLQQSVQRGIVFPCCRRLTISVTAGQFLDQSQQYPVL